jgi:hypothetical protein
MAACFCATRAAPAPPQIGAALVWTIAVFVRTVLDDVQAVSAATGSKAAAKVRDLLDILFSPPAMDKKGKSEHATNIVVNYLLPPRPAWRASGIRRG